MNVQTTRLPEGVRVVTAAVPHVDSASVGVWVGVGGRHEPAALSGMSHFVEHLLFKGTRRLSAREISQAIEGRGGDLNAFTQEENTCYFARVATEHLWRSFGVLMDMYLHPRLAPGDIRRECEVVVEEIQMYRDQPQQRVEELLGQQLWRDHPIGRPLAGTPESVRALDRPAILSFLRDRYVPCNTVVAFAGKVEHAACVDRCAAWFRDLPRGRRQACCPVTDRVGQGRLCVEQKEIEQAQLALGLRLFGRHDERRYALKILSVILGENMSSRLFQVVREKHGLAYSIHSSTHLYEDTGILAVSAGLELSRLRKALRLIVRELARMRSEPVGRNELQRAKDYVSGQLRLGLESTSSQMMWIGEHLLGYGEVIPPEVWLDEMAKLSAEAIRELAEEILTPARMSVALVAPSVTADDEDGVLEEIMRLD